MILDLDKPYKAYWIIGAINRALGDDYEAVIGYKRHYIYPKLIPEDFNDVCIKVHKRIKRKRVLNGNDISIDPYPGRVDYILYFSPSIDDFGKDPMYVLNSKFKIELLKHSDDSLLEKILKEIK